MFIPAPPPPIVSYLGESILATGLARGSVMLRGFFRLLGCFCVWGVASWILETEGVWRIPAPLEEFNFDFMDSLEDFYLFWGGE